MTLREALDIVIARTGHQRFRFLTSEANPDTTAREAYRALVLHLASHEPGRAAPAPIPPHPADAIPRRSPCCG